MPTLQLTQESKELLSANAEFTAKWIAGLRSGKYTQARKAMVDPGIPNSACCLMVMEMECNNRDWRDHLKANGSVAGYPSGLKGGIDWPSRLRAAQRGRFGGTYCSVGPANWNDGFRLSFNQIADLLEHGEVDYDSP